MPTNKQDQSNTPQKGAPQRSDQETQRQKQGLSNQGSQGRQGSGSEQQGRTGRDDQSRGGSNR